MTKMAVMPIQGKNHELVNVNSAVYDNDPKLTLVYFYDKVKCVFECSFMGKPLKR